MCYNGPNEKYLIFLICHLTSIGGGLMSKITVGFELKDATKSVDGVDASGKRLNKTLERTQELMKGTKGGGGTRSAAAAFGQTEYNTARGTVGTGASGRDFAKQSRELDGLVRLYAVYAANIFAAGAAFRALSEAMNTTNMIQGLNQLGAASGVAMGGLAKRFSEASGGAISLRESMEATAKAVSSGLSQAQFLKLGEVAKKASQALGVNMSDAVSRLTRGITKLEPELLDELGIFTKVGKATEDYARAIGKPVSALTDFEKRQAFANAVLEEGARKFGQIEIDTNPYDKLLATLKNVAQSGLEIINTVLAPFAKLLSNNTSLLVGVIGLIGAKIVKDALPAIGQWRSGLKDAADAARQSSSDIAASFGEGFVDRTNAAFKIPQLEANLKASEEAYRASRVKMAQMDTDLSKKLRGSGPGADDKSLKAEQTRYTKEINALRRQGLDINNAQILSLQKERAVVIALRNDIKELNAAQDAALSKASGGSIFERTGDFLRTSAAKSARDKSTRLDILSDVSRNQTQLGFGPAIDIMMKDLDKLPGKFQKIRTGIAGIIIAGAGTIGTAISGLSRFLGPVGIGIGVITAALPLFRKNEEAAARFAGSLDLLKENSENAFRVLERLSKLDPLERISVDNIFAKGTALESLGTSMSKAFTDIETEIKNRNWADSTINFLSSIIGRSSEQLLAKQIGTSLENAIKLSANGASIQQEIAKLLELPAESSIKAIEKALANSSPAIRGAVAKVIEDSGKKAVASAGSLKTFREGLAESSKIYQDLINTTKNATPLTKFAEESTKKILELNNALDGANLPEKLTELTRLSTDINFLQLFPLEAAKNILSTSSELKTLSAELADVDSKQRIYNDALNTQQTIIDKLKASGTLNLVGSENNKDYLNAKKAIESLKQANAGLDTTRGAISSSLQSAQAKFATSMREGLLANIDTFTRNLVAAAAKAGLELQKAALGGVADPVLKAEIQQRIDLEGLKIDRSLLKVQMSLIESTDNLRLAMLESAFEGKLRDRGLSGLEGGDLENALLRNPANRDLADDRRIITSIKENRGKTLTQLSAEIASVGSNTGQLGGIAPASTLRGLGEVTGSAQARAAVQQQLQALDNTQKMIDLKAKLDKIDGESFNKLKEFGDKQKEIDQAQAAFAVKKDSMTEAEFNKDNEAFTLQKSKLAIQIEDEKSSLAVKKAQAVETILLTEEARKNLEYTKENANIAKALTKEERDQADAAARRLTTLSSALSIKDRDAKTSEQAFIVSSAALDKEISINKITQDNLSLQAQLGMLDDESLRTKLNLLKVEETKLEQTKQLTAAQRAYNQEVEKLDRDVEAAGGFYVGSKKTEDDTARARLLENYKAQRSAILLVTQAQIDSAQTMADTTNRQLAYTEMFKQGFKGMEDAIVNFTKTGKLSFKDMINSFIEGLLRYEIQQQQIALFSGLGGAGGLAKLFMGAIGFNSPSPVGPMGDPDFYNNAKGGVYDAGLKTFAKGGMFTNGIVNQPTLFKFAKGTGLMGEAGPEAIMPLKRDSNGNLGVRGGGGSNVDVVVNNYGNEKATTKETVDSRGNRRIEVMIGDMVAGELNRVGSNTQQAMTASYGTSPLVARR
jgi:hypothetical protein